MSQIEETFLYEITLYQRYEHQNLWGEKEKKIHREHIRYLDSLTQNGNLLFAGILDENLENQTGVVILRTKSYEEAKSIALKDPSVKKGMMSVKLRPFHLYFRKEE